MYSNKEDQSSAKVAHESSNNEVDTHVGGMRFYDIIFR